jgi:hypothetical protein
MIGFIFQTTMDYKMKKLLFLLMFPLFSNAASVSTSINTGAYTSIPENGGSGFAITPFQNSQCLFSSSLPSASAVGSRIQQGEIWAVNSTGTNLWCKSESTVTGNNYITTTITSDASINGSNATGGGGGGGNVNLNQVGGASFALGQTNKSGSLPITIASDQGGLAVTGTFWQTTQPVSASSLPLPAGASTSALQSTGNSTLTTINTTLGSPLQSGGSVVVTSAPTTAVTNSGLSNIDVALSTRLKPSDTLAAVTSITNPVSVTGTFWQSIQPISGTVSASQSGTWTVQPGNTANTTAWKVDASATTQPISASALPLPSGASTSSNQSTEITSLGTIATNTGGIVTGITNGVTLSDINDLLSAGGNSAINVAQFNGQNIDTNNGGAGSGTLRVTESTNSQLSTDAHTLAGNSPALGLNTTANSIPVSVSRDVETDSSGTITTGGTSQTLRSANASDKTIEIYNNSSTEPLCFSYGATATLTNSGSYCLAALGYYSNTVNNQQISIIATTTGHKFTATVRQ